MTKTDSTHYSYVFTVGAGNGTANISLSSGTDLFDNLITSSPTSGGSFTIDNATPTISQVTPVTSPTNDSTPDYVFSSNEAGTITYGGSCSSATTSATVGNNTVTFYYLANSTYSNCTIKVTDAAENSSNTINIPSFTVNVDTTPPVRSNGSPNNGYTFPEGTTSVTISLQTDENATCKFQLNGNLDYDSLSNTFSITGNTTHSITLSGLTAGDEYAFVRCMDSAGNKNTDSYTGIHFIIPANIAPTISEKTSVPTTTADTTPDYTFNTDEAGTISYGGSCSSSTTSAMIGNNTITLNTLSPGTYSNCTIRVTDAAGNASSLLSINSFTITSNTASSIYRFWSDTKQGHFYTSSEDEKNHIIATYPESVWRYEGVAWYVPE